jgi:DNA-binding PadR family transcriptional regulator
MASFAVMNIDKGEEIIFALVSGHIPGTGRYKYLAKKLKNGEYEWAHFVERDNGNKEKVYRGNVKSEKELKLVLEIMNKNLKKIFGDKAEMKEGMPEFRSLMGKKFDDSVN